jgi:hypothetical protein
MRASLASAATAANRNANPIEIIMAANRPDLDR